MKQPDNPVPVPAAKKGAIPEMYLTRYLRHPTLGIVMWATPVAMPGMLTHREMADRLPKSFSHRHMAGAVEETIASAGYIREGPDGPECYGDSESLGVKADPSDTKLLWAMLDGGNP